MEITYQDGTTDFVVSDETWKASTGPILEADIFNGETYDARLEKPGWDEPGFADKDWNGVAAVAFDPDVLVAPIGVPVRRTEEIVPKGVIKTPAGETVVDLGQNLAGWIRLRARGPRGTCITLRHGEVLDSAGNFYNKNLRMAKATDRFILKGNGAEEIFEPRFTFHGFQYVKLEGYPGEVTPDCVTGIVVHSDLERTGEFSCANPLVNRLFENIVWTQRSNFLDVPTDCPQRDERMGWTGDLMFFTPTACLNMDSAAFLTRWLRDLKNDQRKNGLVPVVIPDAFTDRADSIKRLLKHGNWREGDLTGLPDKWFVLFYLYKSSAFVDAAVVVPWYLYLAYGDVRILESQYESMRAFFRFIEKRAARFGSFLYVDPRKWFRKATWEHLRYYYTAGFHCGDWLARGDDVVKSIAKSKWYIPTAFYALDALILSKAAAILGHEDDSAYYRKMYERIKAAFQEFRVTKDGKIWPNRQTAYVLALTADLLPDEMKEKAAKILADMVREDGYELGTGFVGTPHLFQVLSRYGHADVAYGLLMQEDHQWLYQVKKGATTIWENMEAIREDGTFQSETMLSFNHFAYGCIGAWLYQGIAGIKVDEERPGYKHVIIEPLPGGRLAHARASYDSIHGRITSGWSLSENNLLTIQVEIPPNTTATVMIPGRYSAQVLEGDDAVALEDGAVEIGSGTYEFSCTG
jgi:alpha-L-rhamnosidase